MFKIWGGSLGRLAVSMVLFSLASVASAAGSSSFAAGGQRVSSLPLLPRPLRWVSSSPLTPHRPSSCPSLATTNPAGYNAPSPSQPRMLDGVVPWPPVSALGNPMKEAMADRTPTVTPAIRPSNWDVDGSDWKLTSSRTNGIGPHKTHLASNPQELCGVEGGGEDRAWQITTGNPETVIAIPDSGIEWCDPGLIGKIALNTKALPPPENAQGKTKAELEKEGIRFRDDNPYDLNDSGVINAAQYEHDPRVLAVARDYGGLFCSRSRDGYPAQPGVVTAMDLIRAFGRPDLPDGKPNPYYYGHQGPPGFTEAIAGWNFVNDNNDPYDDVHFDHGTGEAEDSSGAADTIGHEIGTCPNCMVLPIRVGDSFITSSNRFAEGVLFAVDSGASVIQEALGTIDMTEPAREAIRYAVSHGVPVVASAADEESEHHNLPALAQHTIVVNSVTREKSFDPPSYLYLNGCTNYGANISVSVESSSCSSEATGKTGGVAGLIESEADLLLSEGKLKPYPGERTVQGKPVALSANEVKQLIEMSASEVDFGMPASSKGAVTGKVETFAADNFAVTSSELSLLGIKTTRYPTHPGFTMYFGYGREDAARALRWLSEGKVPPEAQIDQMPWFQVLSPTGELDVRATLGTNLSASWGYQVDVAIGPQPEPGSWRLVAKGKGTGIERDRLIARIPLAQVARLLPRGTHGGPIKANGAPDPDRFTFTVRLVVKASNGMVGISRRAEFLHSSSELVLGNPLHLHSSIVSAPVLAPLGPGGESVLLVASADGTIRALLPNGHELPGWPVKTNVLRSYVLHARESAYESGAVKVPPREEIFGTVAVGDLHHAGGSHLDVVATTYEGEVYAWNARGHLLPGFPLRTLSAYSQVASVNNDNRLLKGFFGGPALADLQGNGRLDIVAASMDRLVYAWQPNGRMVPGWPVLLIDPRKVSSVNPLTGKVSFKASARADQGSKLMDTPAIGRLEGGSGPPDVIVTSNENYKGRPDAYLGSLGTLLSLLGKLSSAGNAMVYAIRPQGKLHSPAPGEYVPPGDTSVGAYLPGWPAKLVDLDPDLLPEIGDGASESPALVPASDVGSAGESPNSKGRVATSKGGSGKPILDVVAQSDAGPLTVLEPNGLGALGYKDGLPIVLPSSPVGSKAPEKKLPATMSIPALGAPIVAPMGPKGSQFSAIAPAASIGELVNEAFPADQRPHENQLDAWNLSKEEFDPGFPQEMNDLQFADEPIVAYLTKSSRPYLIEGSGLYDLRAYDANGQEAPGFPKFTGGWMVQSAVVGPWGRLSDQVIAAGTREGWLFVWKLSRSAKASRGPWPQDHHDLYNTSNLAFTKAPVPVAMIPSPFPAALLAMGIAAALLVGLLVLGLVLVFRRRSS